MLQLCCSYVAAMLPLCCSYVAAMLQLCCSYVAAMLPRTAYPSRLVVRSSSSLWSSPTLPFPHLSLCLSHGHSLTHPHTLALALSLARALSLACARARFLSLSSLSLSLALFPKLAAGTRLGIFSQHSADQLDLNLTPIEYIQKKFPGKYKDLQVSVCRCRCLSVSVSVCLLLSLSVCVSGSRLMAVDSPPFLLQRSLRPAHSP